MTTLSIYITIKHFFQSQHLEMGHKKIRDCHHIREKTSLNSTRSLFGSGDAQL